MRRREAGRGAVPLRASFATKRSGRRRAPPGSITRPCQELADDLGVALPAFGLLARLGEAEAASLRRSQERDSLTGKRGRCRKTPRLARREAPAVSGDGYGAIGFAPFGAPSPHFDEGETVISRTRMRAAARKSRACRVGNGVAVAHAERRWARFAHPTIVMPALAGIQ
jgi:hypothetical protein